MSQREGRPYVPNVSFSHFVGQNIDETTLRRLHIKHGVRSVHLELYAIRQQYLQTNSDMSTFLVHITKKFTENFYYF